MVVSSLLGILAALAGFGALESGSDPPVAPAAVVLSDAAVPVPAAPRRMAAPPRMKENDSSGRARRSPPSMARRLLRKRHLLRPVRIASAAERADLSVPALAADLARAVSALRLDSSRTGGSAPTDLRLLAAGLKATRIHLPPPHTS